MKMFLLHCNCASSLVIVAKTIKTGTSQVGAPLKAQKEQIFKNMRRAFEEESQTLRVPDIPDRKKPFVLGKRFLEHRTSKKQN